MFFANGSLYFVTKSDGNLNKVAFTGGAVVGSASAVSGPAVDQVNWRNRSLFLYAAAPLNQAPTAAFTSSCDHPPAPSTGRRPPIGTEE